MRLSDLLLLSLFILCCTGAADRSCKRLGVEPGHVCALSLLCWALSAFLLPFGVDGGFGLTSLLLLFLSAYACAQKKTGLFAMLLALVSGCLGSLVCRFAPQFSERGLLLAAFSAPMAHLLAPNRRSALLAVIAAPLMDGLFTAAEELYYFDYPLFAFGTSMHLDAQLAGLYLLAALWYLPMRQGALAKRILERKERVQKKWS